MTQHVRARSELCPGHRDKGCRVDVLMISSPVERTSAPARAAQGFRGAAWKDPFSTPTVRPSPNSCHSRWSSDQTRIATGSAVEMLMPAPPYHLGIVAHNVQQFTQVSLAEAIAFDDRGCSPRPDLRRFVALASHGPALGLPSWEKKSIRHFRWRRTTGAYLNSYPPFTPGGSGSVSTFTQAGLPLAKARSIAARICSGCSTNSPCPPRPSTTRS
jgi:hypothetical protein